MDSRTRTRIKVEPRSENDSSQPIPDESMTPESMTPFGNRGTICKDEVDLGMFVWDDEGVATSGSQGQLSYAMDKIAGNAIGLEGMYQPGLKMEALDSLANKWFEVKVLEVDWEEQELLIHFEKWSERFDEWIPMASSRLRTTEQDGDDTQNCNMSAFQVGEMVMATWSDGRKYPATVKTVLGGDNFEVLFFDGFTKSMKINKLAKCSGVEGVEQAVTTPPTTMSKAERRERKRKIQSVAELFHFKKTPKRSAATVKEEVPEPPVPAAKRGTGDFGRAARAVKETSLQTKKKSNHNVSSNSNSSSCYTDLTAGSDNEGEKTYINLNASMTQDDSSSVADLISSPEEKVVKGRTKIASAKAAAAAADQPLPKRKRSYNKVFLDNSPASSPAVRGLGKRYAMGVKPRDYDNWEPDGEEAYLVETSDGLRRSIIVDDDRLPAGWAKHTIQRRAGNSAGKWDVFLVSPCGRRFRSRKEMVMFFAEQGTTYRPELFDFTLRGLSKRPVCNMRLKNKDTEHVKPHQPGDKRARSRRPPAAAAHGSETAAATAASSDAVAATDAAPHRRVKTLLPRAMSQQRGEGPASPPPPPHRACTVQLTSPTLQAHVQLGAGETAADASSAVTPLPSAGPPQADGSGRVCPKVGCTKHFRNESLLQMHIKHYHPEYSQFMGSTPNVADLAYARTVRAPIEDLVPSGSFLEKINRFEATKKAKLEAAASPSPAVSDAAPARKAVAAKEAETRRGKRPGDQHGLKRELRVHLTNFVEDRRRSSVDTRLSEALATPSLAPHAPGSASSAVATTPLRELLRKEPMSAPKVGVTAGIKTLLPITRTTVKIPTRDMPHSDQRTLGESSSLGMTSSSSAEANKSRRKRRLSDGYHKKRRSHVKSQGHGVDDSSDRMSLSNGDLVSFLTPATRHQGAATKKRKTPMLGTSLKQLLLPDPFDSGDGMSPASAGLPETPSPVPTTPLTEEQLNKRDIINCTCGVMEEDGLMIQCDLCLCWQHGYCNNIEKETEVPDKYVCYICQNPLRERKSMRHIHNQDWLKEGVLPSLSGRTKEPVAIAKREALLRRSHDLTATLLDVKEVVRGLHVKLNIANSVDHPKLYLWSKPWVKHTFEDMQSSDTVAKSDHVDENTVKAVPNNQDTNMSVTDTSSIEARDIKIEPVSPSKSASVGDAPLAEGSQIKCEPISQAEGTSAGEASLVDGSEIKSEPANPGTGDASADVSLAIDGRVAKMQADDKAAACESPGADKHVKTEGVDDQNPVNPVCLRDPVASVEEATGTAQTTVNVPQPTASEPQAAAVAASAGGEPSLGSTPQVPQERAVTQAPAEAGDSVVKPFAGLDSHILLHALTQGGHPPQPPPPAPHVGNLMVAEDAHPPPPHPAAPHMDDLMMGQLDPTAHSQLLQFPISQTELMHLAHTMVDDLKGSVTEQSKLSTAPLPPPSAAPEPEKPIEAVECRLLLLDHIQHHQQQIRDKLQLLEDQITALEDEDPDPLTDETMEFYPHTKQTVKMLLRDLTTMRNISQLN